MPVGDTVTRLSVAMTLPAFTMASSCCPDASAGTRTTARVYDSLTSRATTPPIVNTYGERKPLPSIVSPALGGTTGGEIFVTFGVNGSSTVKTGPVVEPATVTLILPAGSTGTTTTCESGVVESTRACALSNVTTSAMWKCVRRTGTCG